MNGEGGKGRRAEDERDPGAALKNTGNFPRCGSVGFFPGVKEKRRTHDWCRGGVCPLLRGGGGGRFGRGVQFTRARPLEGVRGQQRSRQPPAFCAAAAPNAAAPCVRGALAPAAVLQAPTREISAARTVTRAKWSGKNTTRCQRAATSDLSLLARHMAGPDVARAAT